MNWQHYKETALQKGLVPLHPEELYPETPERVYVFDCPVEADRRIGSDERARIQ